MVTRGQHSYICYMFTLKQLSLFEKLEFKHNCIHIDGEVMLAYFSLVVGMYLPLWAYTINLLTNTVYSIFVQSLFFMNTVL